MITLFLNILSLQSLGTKETFNKMLSQNRQGTNERIPVYMKFEFHKGASLKKQINILMLIPIIIFERSKIHIFFYKLLY